MPSSGTRLTGRREMSGRWPSKPSGSARRSMWPLSSWGPTAKSWPATTDAGLDFTVPADGIYQLVVSDMAGKSGSRAAIYRLVVRRPATDFNLQLAVTRVGVHLGGKFDLAVNAVRTGGFQGPIALTVKGLPAGISRPPNPLIPRHKPAL